MSIAVAIALYNGERFVEKQLDVIRNQTLQPDRVVLCDDGSKDNTFEVVRNYIDKYDLGDKWHLYKNEKNLGYIKNFYGAMKYCEEDLIFLGDQDDIWELDKIEKMTSIMNENSSINLLSCRYGIIDAEGNELNSVLSSKADNTKKIKSITVEDIMRAYLWPGMAMCIKNDFFRSILNEVEEYAIPHDLAFAILAADENSFYEYDYVGVYHRRHDNNAAREEHRVSKLLKLERKIKDIDELLKSLNNIIDADLSISSLSKDIISFKLKYLNERKKNLLDGSFKNTLKLYRNKKYNILTRNAFISDLLMVVFK